MAYVALDARREVLKKGDPTWSARRANNCGQRWGGAVLGRNVRLCLYSVLMWVYRVHVNPHDREGGGLVFCPINFWLYDSNFLII